MNKYALPTDVAAELRAAEAEFLAQRTEADQRQHNRAHLLADDECTDCADLLSHAYPCNIDAFSLLTR